MPFSARWLGLSSLFLMGVLCTGASPAWGYYLIGGHWNTSEGPIPYYVSPAGSDNIADNSETLAIQRCLQTWECVMCADLQFRFMGDGPNESKQDGISAFFWLEDGAAWQEQVGADPSVTLGVAQHYEGGTPETVFKEVDVAFNGVNPDFVWSTSDSPGGGGAVDVESICLHESGHLIGLGHACANENELDCLDNSQSIMAPMYKGGLVRQPLATDVEQLCALYPRPKQVCSGKKRLKEPCERDCDCDPGLFCVPDPVNNGRMCSRPCGGNNPACPSGTGCGLGVDSNGTDGFCVRNPDPENPTRRADGMVCARDLDCYSGSCDRVVAINKMVCKHVCQSEADCSPGYVCTEHTCLLKSSYAGVPCPGEDEEDQARAFPFPTPPGCACNAVQDVSVLTLVVLALVGVRRRRTMPA